MSNEQTAINIPGEINNLIEPEKNRNSSEAEQATGNAKNQNASSKKNAKPSATKKLPVNRFFEAYNRQTDGFFVFRSLLRNSSCAHVISPPDDGHLLHLHLKKATTLFDTLPGKELSMFELLLSSNDDQSAQFISLIWEEYELWKKKDILVWQREESDKLPIEFVIKSNQNKNFFSFLVFDWHNPDQHMLKDDKKYFLELKNKQMIETSNESLFQKLYKILEGGKTYHEVCMRIIYEYLEEMEGRIDDEKSNKPDGDEVSPKMYHDDLEKLISIEDVLAMENKKYRNSILEIFVTYWNILQKDFTTFKNRIFEATKTNEGDITFFSLAFQLIERKHTLFETDFDMFVEAKKKKSGHYYETIVKPVARLLLKIAVTQRMHQVQTFIFHQCSYLEINSTPLTNFRDFYKFNNKNIFPLNPKEKFILGALEKSFKNLKNLYEKFPLKDNATNEEKEKNLEHRDDAEAKELEAFRTSYKITAHKDVEKSTIFGLCKSYSTSRNLLFEHHVPNIRGNEKSLFEDILSTAGMSKLIHVIWDEFELWRKEKVLKMLNPSGELLMNYVIRSGDDLNLIAFLMPAVSGAETLVNKKYFLKMQSEQYLKIEKKTLFERYLYIEDNDTRDAFFDLCFYMLEEMNFIHDIARETCVDAALVLANIDEHKASLADAEEKKFISGILEMGKDILQIKDADVKFEHEYDCDKLLKYFTAYWTCEDRNYATYIKKLMKHSPFFKMIDFILNGDQSGFIESFHANLEELVANYNKRFKRISKNETMMQEDLFILFRTAMRNDRKKVMDCILDYSSFEDLQYNFPAYKKANESNHHAALKLLEHGYALGFERFPDDWITQNIMTDFLDSQVKVLDQDIVQMNTNFLLCPFDRKYKIKSKGDIDNQMLFWEYNASLNFIAKSETLKELVLHPVVATYINLKSYKYQKVYEMNFILFFFLYMLPFGFLITYHSFDNLNKTFSMVFLRTLEILCVCSTSLLTVRETFQMVWVSKSWKDYFKSRSNQLELLMIVLSWILLFAIFYLNLDEHIEYFSFLSTLFIITSTVVLLTMLPFKSMPIYMMLLKQVARTFLQFFLFFFFILFAFSISFCVIFRPRNVASISDILSNSNETEIEPSAAIEKEENPEVYQNFDSLVGSFVKTVLMLSGEYTIEPFTLSATKTIIFLIFVLTSFVLFNLILGLAIDDVQSLRTKAEILNLRFEVKKFVESSMKWLEIYENFGLQDKRIRDIVWWKRIVAVVLRKLIINYCFIHKIGKIYVNMKTKEVSFEINRKQEAALTKYSGGAKKYFLEEEVFDRLKLILKERNDKEFEASKEEFDQKAAMESLKQRLEEQNELIKQLLEARK